MYRKHSPQMTIGDFILLFISSVGADNRWVRLAKLIPWDGMCDCHTVIGDEPGP